MYTHTACAGVGKNSRNLVSGGSRVRGDVPEGKNVRNESFCNKELTHLGRGLKKGFFWLGTPAQVLPSRHACTDTPAWACLHRHACTNTPARACLHKHLVAFPMRKWSVFMRRQSRSQQVTKQSRAGRAHILTQVEQVEQVEHSRFGQN